MRLTMGVCDAHNFFCPLKHLKSLQHNNNNNNIYLLQLGCHPVAVIILHVNKT